MDTLTPSKTYKEDSNKMALRVLMISLRADIGGGPEHIYRLTEQISPKVEVYIACPREEPYWERFNECVGMHRMLAIPHRKFTLYHLWRLWKFVRSNNIRIIHSHGKGAGIYGRLLGVFSGRPCVHTFHGLHVDHYLNWQKQLYFIVERCLTHVSARVISVSRGEATLIEKAGVATAGKLIVIPNGVPLSTQKVACKPATSNGKRRIISMSRFDYPKNSQLIIPILKAYIQMGYDPNIELIMLGDGPDRKNIQEQVQAAELSDKIVFAGAVLQPKEYLKYAWCYLSTSRWEGMPLGVLEAMASGLPVVASDVVGNRDVVFPGQTGYLYALNQPEEAAAYLGRLIHDESLREILSLAARQAVIDKFSIEKMAHSTIRIYEEVNA